MAKIHITLVGGQSAPVYKGIIDEQPDKVVLVYSEESVTVADNVRQYACKKIEGLQCEQVLMSTESISEIKEKIKDIASAVGSDDTVVVNISGGTKVWSTLFYDFFKDKAECIFIDQNDNKYDLRTGQTMKLDVDLGVKEVFGLNGINVTYHLLTEYTKEDFEAATTARKMWNFSRSNFCQLTLEAGKTPDAGYWSLEDKRNYLSWDGKDTYSLSLSRWDNSLMKKTIKSPHIHKVMFNYGWFELEVAKLLGEWGQPQQVAMNCNLSSSKKVNGPTLNEIDIIVRVQSKLLFVECKTRIGEEKNSDATTIDKFNNAIRNYGGLSAKGAFFTYGGMYGQAKEKCDAAGILTFSMQEIRRAGKEGKEELFKTLSEHMESTNIR